MTTVSELRTPNWPVLSPQAQRILDRIAPRFKPSGMLVMGPLPPNISNAPKPPRLELYQRELELGEVVHFKPDKGFGHIDTQDGHLFFHVSGYRVPSVHEYKDDSRPGLNGAGMTRHILQLERLPKVTDEQAGQAGMQVPRLCVPPIASGDAILFLSGLRTGPGNEVKKLAQFWTMQKPYQQFLSEQQSLHEEMLEQWVRLAKYRLTLVVTCEAQTYKSTLFEGTETSMLKDWYQHFRDLLNLNEHRTIVLACSEYDESLGSHGPYVDQEPEVTEEWLMQE